MQAADTCLKAATYHTPAVLCQSTYNVTVIDYNSAGVGVIVQLCQFYIMQILTYYTVTSTIHHFQCLKLQSGKSYYCSLMKPTQPKIQTKYHFVRYCTSAIRSNKTAAQTP